MTVSNVVNGAGKVGERTRAAVLRAIKDLGYIPNAAARRLANGSEERVAILMFADSNPFHGDVITAAQHACAKRVVQFTVAEIDRDPFAVVKKLAAAGTSALLVPSLHAASEEFLRYVRNQGVVPVGVLPGTQPVPGFSCVWIDDRSAAYDATAFLISLGHHRIGHILGPRELPSGRERYEGFRLAMRDAGLAVPEHATAQGDYTFRSGLSAVESLLTAEHRPSAIFAANDDMAAGVLSSAYRHDLKVPEELAVMGFDDSMLATRLAPQLSTVKQSVEEVVEAAVELALAGVRQKRATGRAEPIHRKVNYKIIERETTAPLRRSDVS